MNFDQVTEIILVLKERNDIERQRNKLLSKRLEEIENELYNIRGNL